MAARPGAITISIRTGASLDQVVLEVKDVGIGMSPLAMARMFDPHYSTKFAGRGLGLSVVHGVVRAHRGAISVDSAPGEGTTVRLTFPAIPESPATLASWPAVTQSRRMRAGARTSAQ